MSATTLSLIVACTPDRVIGRAGRLAFRLNSDREWFEAQTRGRTLILGRLSHAAWPAAAQEQRRPIVVSRQPGLIRAARPGDPPVRTAPNVTEALALARRDSGEIMVCGGQRIYEETLPLADRIYLTLVQTSAPGDRWFPEWRHLAWREGFRQDGTEAGVPYSLQILERVRP